MCLKHNLNNQRSKTLLLKQIHQYKHNQLILNQMVHNKIINPLQIIMIKKMEKETQELVLEEQVVERDHHCFEIV